MNGAEINLFLDSGAGHVKILVPLTVTDYDDKGNATGFEPPEPTKLAALVNGYWQAFEKAGHAPSAAKRGGGGNPNWKPKPPVEVKVDGGAAIKVVCPTCGKDVYDNREENDKREKEGLRRRPDFKCRDKDCQGIIWNAIDVVVKDALDSDPDALPFE